VGFVDRVNEAFTQPVPPDNDEITRARWSACHGGQRAVAEYLLERGADINWIGWDHLTPLDAAAQSEADELVDWLRDRGAKRADELS
jgi:ankyrin repeat protein